MRRSLKTDPTRTTLLRRQFEKAMRERFLRISRALADKVGAEDAFGLNPRQITPFSGASTGGGVVRFNAAFDFRTDEAKLKAFAAWLDEQVKAGLLTISEDGYNAEKPWLSMYVESAYRKGLVNAYAATTGSKGSLSEFEQGKRAQFLQSAFAAPEQLSKVRFLATRAYEDLKGISAFTAQRLNREMAGAIANGYGAMQTARILRDSLGIPENRARILARTEIIAAHAQGQLDGFKALGVKEVGVMAEWQTGGDDRVCPKCSAMMGKVFTVEEAQGLIPLHPSCRCSFLPHLGSRAEKTLRTSAG